MDFFKKLKNLTKLFSGASPKPEHNKGGPYRPLKGLRKLDPDSLPPAYFEDVTITIVEESTVLEEYIDMSASDRAEIPLEGFCRELTDLLSPRDIVSEVMAPDASLTDPEMIVRGPHVPPSRPVDASAELASPQEPPRRYTDILLFDAQHHPLEVSQPLQMNERYTLDVAIRCQRIGLGRGREDQRPFQVPDQTDFVTLFVVVSDESDDHDAFENGPLYFERSIGELTLPPVGDSMGKCDFSFTARLDGPGRSLSARVGVRIYHKLNLIDHSQLNLRFGADCETNQPNIEILFKNVASERGVENPNQFAAARSVTISISKPTNSADNYILAFAAGSNEETGEPKLHGVKKLPESLLNSWVSEFRNILLDVVFGPSFGKLILPPDECQEILVRLSLLGRKIVVTLFDYGPRKSDFFLLGKMLRETLPDAALVQIVLSKGAEDLVFPWQILTITDYDEDNPPVNSRTLSRNLWGFRFVIEVKRCGDGADCRPIEGHAPLRARVNYGRWPFKNEPQHFAKLESLVNASNDVVQLMRPIVETRADMLAALQRGGGELFYLYAHGYSAAPIHASVTEFHRNTVYQIEALDKKIKANLGGIYSTEQLEAWKDIYQRFAKAIATGADSALTLSGAEVALTYLLTKMQGGACQLRDAPIIFLNTCDSAQVWNAIENSFVSLFLNNGARAVLGTETTIPVVLADEFGHLIFKAILEGRTLGQAVLEGRRKVLDDFHNPLGLCYCIYGAADARLLRFAS